MVISRFLVCSDFNQNVTTHPPQKPHFLQPDLGRGAVGCCADREARCSTKWQLLSHIQTRDSGWPVAVCRSSEFKKWNNSCIYPIQFILPTNTCRKGALCTSVYRQVRRRIIYLITYFLPPSPSQVCLLMGLLVTWRPGLADCSVCV